MSSSGQEQQQLQQTQTEPGSRTQVGEMEARLMRSLASEQVEPSSAQQSQSTEIEPNVEFEQRIKEQVREGKEPKELPSDVPFKETTPEELERRKTEQRERIQTGTRTGPGYRETVQVSEEKPKEVHIIEQKPGEAIYIRQQPSILYQSQLYPAFGRGKMTQVHEPTIDLFNRLVAKDTHCLLGRTGVKVSRICLGTMNFGQIDRQFGDRPGQLDEDQAHQILDRYVQLGGNCIDTADFFPWFGSNCGQSETILGNWLQRQDREQLFLVTKVRLPTDVNNINSGGLSRSHIIDSVNKSLKRLKTDYVDMLMLNGWDPTVSVYEVVRHLNDLVESNRVRYIGVCDFKGWQLQKFIDASRLLNLHKCVCYEGEYNLLTRGCEWEVMDVCRNERIGFFAYSPFKYGFLTSQYTSSTDRPVEGTRIEAASKQPNLVSMAEPFEEMHTNPLYANLLSVCERIGRERNITTAQIAILWALQRGFVTSVVCGVNNVRELEENMACLTGDLALSQQELLELDMATRFRMQYPYTMHLASIAGYRQIDPRWAVSFEQLSFLNESVPFEQMEQLRLNPRETFHESRSQQLPEQEYLRQTHTRSGEQQIKQEFPQFKTQAEVVQ